MILLMYILTWLAGFAPDAFRHGPVIDMAIMCAPGVKCLDQVYIAKDAIKYIESQFPIKFQITRIADVDRIASPGGPGMRLLVYRGLAAYKEYKHDIVLLYVPNSDWFDSYVLGATFKGSFGLTKNAVVYVRTEERAVDLTTTIHELGHTLGAPHENCGVMIPAYDPVEIRKGFCEYSKAAIRKHLGLLGIL